MLIVNDFTPTTLAYLMPFRKKHFYIYVFVLLLVTCCIAVLPFLSTTISVNAQGITRPEKERTEVKNVVGGIIDKIYYKEGDTIAKGAVLLRIKDNVSHSKRMMNDFNIEQAQSFVKDLSVLVTASLNEITYGQLSTPLYKDQLNQYISTAAQQQADLRKATKELKMSQQLVNEKVIAPKEFFDTQVAYDKAIAASKSLERTQRSNWQQDLIKYRLQIAQSQEQLNEVNSDAGYYTVKAPTSGVIQNINTLYAGGCLQVGQTICSISPDDSLLAECYVSTKNIGMIKINQPVIFQIDAFDYNYFGTVKGKVTHIGNDYINQQQGQAPVFVVRCRFNTTKLALKNGYQNSIKKGLTFQARFVVGKRTLWQLLWDKVDDWLNPNAPPA